MKYIDVKTAAEQWNLTERRVTYLCRAGKVNGATKEGGVWLIPENAQKPEDGRKSKGKAMVMASSKRLPLPIGESDFKNLVENYYYVDKTLLIKDFLDTKAKVTLFTRPRRFGKTLNMDMLKTFFEISDEDTSKYFKNMNIWSCGDEYRKEQGKYPVIHVSFKDVKFSTWTQTFSSIRDAIATEYKRHIGLLESSKCNEYDKKYFRTVIDGTIDEVGLAASFRNLSEMLMSHYGRATVIIIDEYDTPIQQGYTAGYYEDVVGFMRNLFSGAFKDNNNLAYGFLTGILRVAKESIFSGLNNLKLNSILEERYSEYFGFTKADISAIMQYYGRSDKYDEICEWYDGYRFGNTDIFNPWSVLNYLDENCYPKAFWQSTGDSSVIRQIVSEADIETSENLRKLMQGQTVSSYIDTSVVYPEIKGNPSTIYSFLLATGYLKTVRKDNCHDGNAICNVSIPNREIYYVYEKEILSALSGSISPSTAISIQQAILSRNVPMLREHLEKMLKQTISSFDYAHENFYHGLLLGICAIMNNLYRVDSNKESGYGRYDIQLLPNDITMHGIIMELKVIKEDVSEDNIDDALVKSANIALEQIDKKQYITEMKREGVSKFLKIGVAFHKKHVQVVYSEE